MSAQPDICSLAGGMGLRGVGAGYGIWLDYYLIDITILLISLIFLSFSSTDCDYQDVPPSSPGNTLPS
jgi:hypothetical protein